MWKHLHIEVYRKRFQQATGLFIFSSFPFLEPNQLYDSDLDISIFLSVLLFI